MLTSGVVRVLPIKPQDEGGFEIQPPPPEDPIDRRPIIGYCDEGYYYLVAAAIFKELGEYRGRGRNNAGRVNRRSVIAQLMEDGLLVPNETKAGTNSRSTHALTVKKFGEKKGPRVRVLMLPRSALDDEAEQPGAAGREGPGSS